MNDQDIAQARAVVAQLWAALAKDDDAAAEGLYVPFRLEKEIGHDALLPGQEPLANVGRRRFLPGSAARLRDRFRKSRKDCARQQIRGVQPFEDNANACVVVSGPRGPWVGSPHLLVSVLTVARYGDEWLIWGQPPGWRGETVLTLNRGTGGAIDVI